MRNHFPGFIKEQTKKLLLSFLFSSSHFMVQSPPFHYSPRAWLGHAPLTPGMKPDDSRFRGEGPGTCPHWPDFRNARSAASLLHWLWGSEIKQSGEVPGLAMSWWSWMLGCDLSRGEDWGNCPCLPQNSDSPWQAILHCDMINHLHIFPPTSLVASLVQSPGDISVIWFQM